MIELLLALLEMPDLSRFTDAMREHKYEGELKRSLDDELTHSATQLMRFSTDDIREAVTVLERAAYYIKDRPHVNKGSLEAHRTVQSFLQQGRAETFEEFEKRTIAISFKLSNRARLLFRIVFDCDVREEVTPETPPFGRWGRLSHRYEGDHVDRQFPLIYTGGVWSLDPRMSKSLAGTGGWGGPLDEFEYYAKNYERRKLPISADP